MMTILGLAVISMLISVFMAETTEGFAAAINQAGTLRMQSYRIASSLVHGSSDDTEKPVPTTENLINEFEERLFSPRIHNVLEKGPSKRVQAAYQAVASQWQTDIFPHLRVYLELLALNSDFSDIRYEITRQQAYFLSNVDGFVNRIHHFVKVLELDAEEKNSQLRIIQIFSLILILLVALVSLFLLQVNVLRPLRDLLACARAARHGDFTVRSKYLSEDELGQLGHAFNVMAEDLSKIYSDLETRVQEQTAHLERSNRSLELLYKTTRRLNDSSLESEVLVALIHDIEDLIGVNSGTICLGRSGDESGYQLASTNSLNNRRQADLLGNCQLCIRDGTTHTFGADTIDGKRVNVFSTPIRDQVEQFGVLLVEFSEKKVLEEWQQRLLETVASHIALSINVAQRASQGRMLSLMEERSVIARELHDSIAQSLSYLKIQVSRLEKSVSEAQDQESILSITQVLRSALNGAYRQLRELLTSFRLRVNEAGLDAALENTVREYADRSGIRIELVDRVANCRFSPNAEIHVIQIIREALSNVIRHASATTAQVLLECQADGVVRVRVEDDGIGITGENGDMMQHYGLTIMTERAAWLGGELSITEADNGGTRIELTFSISGSDHTLSHENLLQKMNNAKNKA
ncbi:MAG: type IV pili methyl-accepting chemotaxis transducer N-terminal domain-containing protein [gamma proteobacterium endosymbiont of Lamellibrachia anaximandri]|nr:type IV pili methyl-accepting chemotaxis transducer N-terminal domain-containing protein [gamma proteobacterium endosymbiont of Lamellibrachia anaximandri]